ncbi:MAG TPA: hypothetical protein VGE77_08135 [Nocardioides sp.]
MGDVVELEAWRERRRSVARPREPGRTSVGEAEVRRMLARRFADGLMSLGGTSVVEVPGRDES